MKYATIAAAATLLVINLLTINQAHADTLTWSWTAPTARSDGTAFDMATEGKGYRVWFNGVAEQSLLSGGANGLEKTFQPGQVCAEFTTVDKQDRESIKSPPSCKDVMAPPGEPSNVTVTITVGP